MAVIECWLECTSTFSVEAITTEMLSASAQQQAQQERSKELLGRLVSLWNEEDALLLRQLLVLPPHEHWKEPASIPVSHQERIPAFSYRSCAFTFNPAVYAQVLQTAIWLCCRVPRHLKAFLPICLELAFQLEETLCRAKEQGLSSIGHKASCGELLKGGAKADGLCGIQCVPLEAARVGGVPLLEALRQKLQDEGLRLLASPLCRNQAALALLEAAGRRAPLRVLQREAQSRFSGMWSSCTRGGLGDEALLTLPLKEGGAAEASAQSTGRRQVEQSCDEAFAPPSSSVDSRKRKAAAEVCLEARAADSPREGEGSLFPGRASLFDRVADQDAEKEREGDADSFREDGPALVERAARFAAEETSQVWELRRQQNGVWTQRPREVDATALVLQVASEPQLTSLLLSGLHRKTNREASRKDVSKSRAALTAEALLSEANAQLQRSLRNAAALEPPDAALGWKGEAPELPGIFSEASGELSLAAACPPVSTQVCSWKKRTQGGQVRSEELELAVDPFSLGFRCSHCRRKRASLPPKEWRPPVKRFCSS